MEDAFEVYHAIAGHHAEDLTAVCRTAFQALCGYGRKEAAIRLGQTLLERVPNDSIIGYHLDALRGHAYERAPCTYLKASFDKYAPDFDRHLVEVLDYRLPDKLHPLLVETGKTFSRILYLGCGTGLSAPHLASFGGHLTGVDISLRMLDKARERNLYDRLIEDEAILYLAKREEHIDLIVSLDVLVYFGDLESFFAAAAGCLVSGGVFAFSFETGKTQITRFCRRDASPTIQPISKGFTGRILTASLVSRQWCGLKPTGLLQAISWCCSALKRSGLAEVLRR